MAFGDVTIEGRSRNRAAFFVSDPSARGVGTVHDRVLELHRGGLAELADADGSKSSDRKVMGVQVPRPLPSNSGALIDGDPDARLP
jgi:hypothetical protein